MDTDLFTTTLITIGVVIIGATLLSGFIDRSGLPHVAVFLAIGALLGPHGAGYLAAGVDSPTLRVVSTLSLALVLFTDAITLDVRQLREHVGLVLRVLGPGTLLSAGVIAVAAYVLLGIPVAGALVLGAALASTDPVLLRGLVRMESVPPAARLGLRLESGLNDAVLLPIILLAMPFMAEGPSTMGPGRLALGILVLGPVLGMLVGFLAVRLLEWVRKRTGIRRDYESIYSLGVAFTAFALGEAVHGSGFLAAFAAGLMILKLDVELCDCFIEYGETTAEMALLFTFVLFGVSTIWQGFTALSPSVIAFAVIALVTRPLVFPVALAGSTMDRGGRWIVSWFGPRGLSTLLLVMLPVFAGLPGATTLLSVSSIVVLLSVVVHGASIVVLARRAPAAEEPLPVDSALPKSLTVDDITAMRKEGREIIIGDVRTSRTLGDSTEQAAGAVRLDPEHPVDDATRLGLPKQVPIALYCA